MTDDYSRVEHLAYAFWPDGRFERSHFMMLNGYFDDSGHVSNKKVLLVCGFVAPVGQWKMFEKDWRAILRMPRFDLDYLHMKEFRAHRGKFEKFKDNLELQTDLFSRLYNLLELRIARSFGCTVLLEDWERVNADWTLREAFGHPFALAGCATITKAIRWMEQDRPGDRIKFVFDQGTDGWGDLRTMAQKMWIDEVIPTEDSFRNVSALQAADHVAWELHRFATKAVDAKFAPKSVIVRGSLDSLMAKFQQEDTWLLANETELRRMCEKVPLFGPRAERRVSNAAVS